MITRDETSLEEDSLLLSGTKLSLNFEDENERPFFPEGTKIENHKIDQTPCWEDYTVETILG